MAIPTYDIFQSGFANQMMTDMERQLSRGMGLQQSAMNQALQGQSIGAGLGGGLGRHPLLSKPSQDFLSGAVTFPRAAPYDSKAYSPYVNSLRGELQSEVDEWLEDIP